MRERIFLVVLLAVLSCTGASAETWRADNGNGTFTNPLFYDEFSDPDLIRVGDDFYLTGTTMHSMPGLPVLTSKDLVNWRLVSYALERLDLGPSFRLEDGKGEYGRGIWAPSFRYRNGIFHIFSNVNGQTTQLFTAPNPAGPWKRQAMKKNLHDLSVLFEDDGTAWVVWGYQGIRMAQLTPDLLDTVPGTERELIPPRSGMGEGVHIYKINGKYYLTSAWFQGRMRLPVARADRLEGPYEVNRDISEGEDFGLNEGYRTGRGGAVVPPNYAPNGRVSLHQGGLVQTQKGEWWGFSMMDYNSVGRLTAIAPVTWKDGWPYFGLPGNLGRNPRTWIKPDTGHNEKPGTPYTRNDDFNNRLVNAWQWSHVPLDSAWSLTARRGYLRLSALPAADLWSARNKLTQRAVGPQSSPIALLDASGLKDGDVAGLSLFISKEAYIGVERGADGFSIVQFNADSGQTVRERLARPRVWLKADADYMAETARFSYSTDGKSFKPLGGEYRMVYSLKSFQGVRYELFAYNSKGAAGGHADFDSFRVIEPHPRGLMHGIPYGRGITLTSYEPVTGSLPTGLAADGTRGAPGRFIIEDRGLGRAALRGSEGYLTVALDGGVQLAKARFDGPSQSFQWSETPSGETVLMSLVTNRYLRLDPASGRLRADSPGPQSDGKDGSRFVWTQ